MKIAESSTGDIVHDVRELANNGVDRLASMAAYGANGDPGRLLLAASAISLQQDVNLAFHAITNNSKLVFDEIATEAGYTDTLREKWAEQMKAVQTDNAVIRAENEVIKAENAAIKTELAAMRTENAGIRAENQYLKEHLESMSNRLASLEQLLVSQTRTRACT